MNLRLNVKVFYISAHLISNLNYKHSSAVNKLFGVLMERIDTTTTKSSLLPDSIILQTWCGLHKVRATSGWSGDWNEMYKNIRLESTTVLIVRQHEFYHAFTYIVFLLYIHSISWHLDLILSFHHTKATDTMESAELRHHKRIQSYEDK